MKAGNKLLTVTITFETIVDIEDKQLSFLARTKRHPSAQEQEMLNMCTKILKATNYMEIK